MIFFDTFESGLRSVGFCKLVERFQIFIYTREVDFICIINGYSIRKPGAGSLVIVIVDIGTFDDSISSK